MLSIKFKKAEVKKFRRIEKIAKNIQIISKTGNF